MERLEYLRAVVDQVLESQSEFARRRAGYVHLYGVSALAAQLALGRGESPELAAAGGMLHDIYTYRTGFSELHAENSAEDARTLLRDVGDFTPEEQQLILQAIRHHSEKPLVGEPFWEVLKDADVLQRHLYLPSEPVAASLIGRLRRTLGELGLVDRIAVDVTPPASSPVVAPGLRQRVAALAEELASQPLVGSQQKSGPDVFPLLRYFPGATPEEGFDWCAAFVYHCLRSAGLLLPIRHQLVSCRFAAVLAWLEWAQLPEVAAYHPVAEPGFLPARGDLIIFDRLVSDAVHDHIGVVLATDGDSLLTAEGNVENRSGVFRRHPHHQVNGFIRLPQ